MKRAEPYFVGLVLGLAAALRLVALHADPPGWLSWSAGLFSDEGIYSEDSRLWVLYGQHMQGDFRMDAIAPLQYHLMIFVFRHVRTISLATVREVAVCFTVATLACFWGAMRKTYGARAAAFGLALLAFSAPYFLYSRMGLLEAPALFWLSAGFLALACAGGYGGNAPATTNLDQRPAALAGWLVAAGALAAVAVAWKATFAVGALALLAAAAMRHKQRAIAALAGFGVVLASYYAVLVRPVRREIGRADRYYLTHQYLPRSIGGVWHNLVRAAGTGTGDGVLVYLVHFAPVLLALTLAAVFAPRLRSRTDAWLWLWLALPTAVMCLLNYSPSRYFVQFWPALAGLAACALARMPRRAAATLLAGALCLDVLVLGHTYSARTYTIQNDAATLEHTLPPDAWIAGQFAPTICMECSLRSLYVQKGLANDNAAALTLLPITHVLATRTASAMSDPWQGDYNQLIAAPGGLRTLRVGKQYHVDLYANLHALP